MDLKSIVKKYGKENLTFIVQMSKVHKCLFMTYTNHDDPKESVPCKIEESRYKLEDGYKVELVPTIDGYSRRETFYQSDLESIIRDGHVKVLIDVSKEFAY
jgi:hypothetical protein